MSRPEITNRLHPNTAQKVDTARKALRKLLQQERNQDKQEIIVKIKLTIKKHVLNCTSTQAIS